ncbi:pseudoazurin [Methylohalomonas lacus]|uniref:Pseudoazurin n=1 Tax=Methylohalomonas lacus TaxID=398773 RepID=A0AAE3L5J9_9GAMM|nr:plastocyanin/azurin family copper-binding protein [Methylohalomonas lacus]MCS3903432.1 pseudoazurin [Methylohalomonas lacus]
MKPSLILSKVILLAFLLGLASACSDNGERSSPSGTDAPADSATTESAADSDSATAETTTAADNTDSGDSATATAAADSDGADSSGGAERHTITARSTAYDPMVLKIKPGDSVSWVNMGGHNNNFEKGNIPEGAEPWKTQLGNDVSKTFDVEGLYLYKCDPHFAMGMVGAIIVGEPDNLAAVEENAKGMYKRALAKAKAQL